MWPTDGTRIYRDVRWGDLGHLFVLDTRQYRDGHSPGAPLIGIRALGQAEAVPTRSILGADQKSWLLGGLADAQADGVPWKLIGNPTMIAPIRVVDLDTPQNRALDPNLLKHAGFYTNSNFDSWDGFPVERDAVLAQLDDGGIENVSFLSGDYHSFWQAGLTPDFDDPTAPVVANDFAAGRDLLGRWCLHRERPVRRPAEHVARRSATSTPRATATDSSRRRRPSSR